MAIDRKQINEIRNNGVFAIANGHSWTRTSGTQEPRLPEVQPKKAKAARRGGTRPQTGSSTSCSSTPTTPRTAPRPSSSRSSSPRPASTPRSSRTTRRRSSSALSRRLQHPAVAQPARRVHGPRRRRFLPRGSERRLGYLMNFGGFSDADAAGAARRGPGRDRPRERKQIYQDVNKRDRREVYNVSAWYVTG